MYCLIVLALNQIDAKLKKPTLKTINALKLRASFDFFFQFFPTDLIKWTLLSFTLENVRGVRQTIAI